MQCAFTIRSTPHCNGTFRFQNCNYREAPGTSVYKTGIPWDDPSERQLRKWLGVTDEVFYDETKIALIPMEFCYPRKGKTGDLPPRPECAPQWHEPFIRQIEKH